MIYNYFERIDCIRCNRGNENRDYRWHSHERALFKLTGIPTLQYSTAHQKKQFAWASSKLLGHCVDWPNRSQSNGWKDVFVFSYCNFIGFILKWNYCGKQFLHQPSLLIDLSLSFKLCLHSYECTCLQMGYRFGKLVQFDWFMIFFLISDSLSLSSLH